MEHPDFLAMTWGQFRDWQLCAAQEPWGEERADLRTLALAAWIKTPQVWSGDLPDLIYPYFQTAEVVRDELALLGKQAADIKAKKEAQRRTETLAGG